MIKKLMKTGVMEELVRSMERIRQNPMYLAYVVLSDLLFLFFYGFFVLGKSGIFTGILYNWQRIMYLVSRSAEEMLNTYVLESSIMSAIRVEPDIISYVLFLLLFYLIALVVIYIIYCLFQGISWKISSSMAGRKIGLKKYIKDFALVNIFWFMLFALYHMLSLFEEFGRTVIMKSSSRFSILEILITVFLAVIVYFALISYALIGKYKPGDVVKKAFRVGRRKIRKILGMYAVIAIVLVLLNLAIKGAFIVHQIAAYIIGIAIVVPSFALLRIFIISYVNRIDTK